MKKEEREDSSEICVEAGPKVLGVVLISAEDEAGIEPMLLLLLPEVVPYVNGKGIGKKGGGEGI